MRIKQKHLMKFTTQQKKEVNSMMVALSHDTNNFNIKIQTIQEMRTYNWHVQVRSH